MREDLNKFTIHTKHKNNKKNDFNKHVPIKYYNKFM